MLQLKQITKEYQIGKKDSKDYQIVKALNGVDLNFRQSEFVSILGPSGCGKTTMLNIIGGLDKYTSGDLVIKGKSTKEFKDKDWDNYRNHSIGFVFQSYNLIHHQTILHNVELALTLSGVKRKERTARALEALDKVGLKERANAKPNQLSGGQMQRVAIARAIVNDPDIILADEPTGALDSKTSVQIMDILKELSKTRLVIMVTHNPELAEEYSSRIVRLKDGELIDDTNPYNPENEDSKTKKSKKQVVKSKESNQALNSQDVTTEIVKKPKKRMSFWTALGLSFKNLLTKKTRTILVSFAGSIGIIGIALILAVSSGFNGYINKLQEDTLSSYPIVIEEQSVNYMNIMTSMFSGSNQTSNNEDGVYADDTLSSLLDTFANGMETNDMKSFNTYLQANYDKIEPYVNAIKYTYNLDLHIYKDSDTNFTQSLSPSNSSLYNLIINYSLVYLQQQTNVKIEKIDEGIKLTKQDNSDLTFFETYAPYSTVISNIRDDLNSLEKGYSVLNEKDIVEVITILFRMDISAYKSMDIGLFNEMIDNEKFIKSQYKLLSGNWNNDKVYVENGKTYADTLLVLNDNNELDDYLLYALGFIDETEMDNLFNAMLEDKSYNIKIDYSKIVGTEFKLYLKSDTYYNNGTKYVQTDTKTPSDEFKNNYVTLRISGIVKVNDETKGGALDEGLVYPKALTDYCIDQYNTSAPVVAEDLAPIDKGSPKSISIYANSFEMKEVIEDFISEYNSQVGEDQKITYTDYMGLMMSMVGSIVDTVSYVLIAFVSVSLIVSSIMIGIITYISVLERTKEIGVLRSVGASKRDIKRVFTAESLIIGFSAGALGIIVTLLLCIPINIIMKAFTGISTIASLPMGGGIILVLISMLLTFIAGLIPAQVASKKDPVIALRSE
ncbi:MAG: ATP-binding cassette domain-containing protein [Clostridia bacterium]|nr:ATP-binding cassette domain-containing protein [Clostridia bacterium]